VDSIQQCRFMMKVGTILLYHLAVYTIDSLLITPEQI